jgi:hypothetical protein
MGCDIHLFVEVRQQDGAWKSVDEWETEDDYIHVPYKKSYYDGRNYDLFAILANVRNGHGFAGVKTGEGFNPIALPKGLPDDVSEQVKQYSDRWDSDGHSHSWLTVAELLAFDWTQTTTKQGWVTWETFDFWVRYPDEPPENYCVDVSGGKVQHVSNDEMKSRIEECRKTEDYSSLESVYTLVQWESTYAVAAGPYWWTHTVVWLLRLGKPEDVRLVFFFDN